jgi:hypothetical protein
MARLGKIPMRSDGCPSRVYVTQDAVVILEQVFFDTGKATIKKQSFGLLNDVAVVLRSYPSIQKVRVEGHTDDQSIQRSQWGTTLRLSAERALAVADFLTDKAGLKAADVSIAGYSQYRPAVGLEGDPARLGVGADGRHHPAGPQGAVGRVRRPIRVQPHQREHVGRGAPLRGPGDEDPAVGLDRHVGGLARRVPARVRPAGRVPIGHQDNEPVLPEPGVLPERGGVREQRMRQQRYSDQ